MQVKTVLPNLLTSNSFNKNFVEYVIMIINQFDNVINQFNSLRPDLTKWIVWVCLAILKEQVWKMSISIPHASSHFMLYQDVKPQKPDAVNNRTF